MPQTLDTARGEKGESEVSRDKDKAKNHEMKQVSVEQVPRVHSLGAADQFTFNIGHRLSLDWTQDTEDEAPS